MKSTLKRLTFIVLGIFFGWIGIVGGNLFAIAVALIFLALGLSPSKHNLVQYRFFRRIFGGTYYHVNVIGMPVASHWRDYAPIRESEKLIGQETHYSLTSGQWYAVLFVSVSIIAFTLVAAYFPQKREWVVLTILFTIISVLRALWRR